jgi:hypothetical protein
VRTALPFDPEKLPSPLYVAVTVSDPRGALVDEHDADRLVTPAEHRVVVPAVKVTVPVGVPTPEVGTTVAEYDTDPPLVTAVGSTEAVVVVGRTVPVTWTASKPAVTSAVRSCEVTASPPTTGPEVVRLKVEPGMGVQAVPFGDVQAV